MKILGIDYGDKKIGLALAHKQSIALPYKIIANQGLPEVLQQLQEIIKEENIEMIVVGLPLSLNNRQNDRWHITKKFVDYLKNNLSLPIDTVNEQFTSKIYTKLGINKDIDKHAATAILDTWLTQNKDE